jgi:hypothetical protein
MRVSNVRLGWVEESTSSDKGEESSRACGSMREVEAMLCRV